jgi:predicted nucleotidyltransferase
MEPLQHALPRLAEYLGSRPEILLAYLFGSVAQGRTHALSDLDIAVLVDPERFRELNANNPWGYQASLTAALMEILGRNDVDLVLLHRAPPLLAREVIRFGKLLCCRDEELRVAFEVRVHQAYLDTAHLREIQRSYLYEAARTGRFGRRMVLP